MEDAHFVTLDQWLFSLEWSSWHLNKSMHFNRLLIDAS